MADVIKLGGYAGGGSIDGCGVFINSGSVTTTQSPGYLEMMNLPKTGSVNRVIHSDGTVIYEVQMSFEAYSASSGLFSAGGLFARGRKHTFTMSDGYNGVSGTDGYITSASVSAQTGGIVSGNISMVCGKKFTFGTSISNAFTGESLPLGYWYSGGDGKIASWTFSMSQTANPFYGNANTKEPLYIQVLGASYSLNVESYKPIESDTGTDRTASISVGFGTLTLTGSITGSSYSFNGNGGLGTYSYTFETGSTSGHSNQLVIS